MSIYVYRRPRSTSALELARALGGRRVRELPQLTKDDVVVCWGEHINDAPCRVLNGAVPLRSKLTDAKILRAASVSTIEVSTDDKRGKEGWLPRTSDHHGGLDLLKPGRADFWVKKLDIAEEFRVHSFRGKSIRAGVKIHRKDFKDPHPWIRSWDGGWRIVYDGKSIKQAHRDIAHAAIKALGLDFGAVDLGRTVDGSLVVLEVNRAPGIEGGTLAAYQAAIEGWIGK